jgi:hypothetical protein
LNSVRRTIDRHGLFKNFEENFKNVTVPQWISFDMKTKTAEIKELPKVDNSALMFDLNSVIGFYSR